MTDITHLDPDDSQFHTMLSKIAEANDAIAHWWIEDDSVPYTAYDRYRDVRAVRRMDFLRRIAPRV